MSLDDETILIRKTIIDSETESPPAHCPPVKLSDWDSLSSTLNFNSVSNAFTGNYTDSEPGGIDTSCLYTPVEEQEKDTARKRYLRCRNGHIRERVTGG